MRRVSADKNRTLPDSVLAYSAFVATHHTRHRLYGFKSTSIIVLAVRHWFVSAPLDAKNMYPVAPWLGVHANVISSDARSAFIQAKTPFLKTGRARLPTTPAPPRICQRIHLCPGASLWTECGSCCGPSQAVPIDTPRSCATSARALCAGDCSGRKADTLAGIVCSPQAAPDDAQQSSCAFARVGVGLWELASFIYWLPRTS
jgi:hypothetical protein